jgi:hypothetical protein
MDLGKDLGVSLGHLVAGIAGGLTLANVLKKERLSEFVSSVVIGGLTAAYLTPVVAEMVPSVGKSESLVGFAAFTIGLMGKECVTFITRWVRSKVAGKKSN